MGGSRRFFLSHRVVSLITALVSIHLLQSTTALADLLPADASARPDGVSIEARLGAGSQWETSDADKVMGVWDTAASWARGQLSQSTDPFFGSRTISSTYDDLWWLKSVRAPEAWGLSTGRGVTVAVVDTGIDHGHEDLAENVWTNAGEIAGNGIDDDGNGYVDDWRGWDFANNDNDVMDDNGHGTHVAGIIGALKDNGKGIAGVAPNAKILGIKVLDKSGAGDFMNIVKGIRYAVDAGARVINLSLGAIFTNTLEYIRTQLSSYYNAVLKPIEDAIAYAAGKGSIVVASSGNSGADVNRTVPAGFTQTISVGATTPTGGKAYFSNTGSTLDLTAPGWDVLSLRAAGTNLGTSAGAGYTRASGTSMAAPIVSGVIALMLAQDPALNLEGIERRLKFSAKDLGAKGFDTSFGHGQVDALNAITHDYRADGGIKTLWLLDADASGMVRYDYDASGRTVSSVGKDGRKYFYDSRGDRTERYASGRIKSRVDAVTGALYEYLDEDLDGNGSQRVSQKTSVDGTVESYVYWGSSLRLRSVQVQSGPRLKSVKRYDIKGTLTEAIETNGDRKTETLFWGSGKPRQITVWQGASRVSQAQYYANGVMSYLILFKNNRPASLTVYKTNGKPLYTYIYPAPFRR